jgi:periplasmic protein CpxP/Spy
MSYWNRHLVWPLARATMVALLGTPLILSPLAVADAQTKRPPAASSPADANDVEQRITHLHAELKITPDQEGKWTSVAQAIRDNDANMEKLIADVEQRADQNQKTTAVDDLETSVRFAQARLDGLKNLAAAFKQLYASMSDEQKKNADEILAKMSRPSNQD